MGPRAQRRQPGGGRAYAEGEARFQHRAAQTMVVGAFLTDFYAMVQCWADWASTQVENWPDDPRKAQPDSAALADIARRADGSAIVQRVPEAQRVDIAEWGDRPTFRMRGRNVVFSDLTASHLSLKPPQDGMR